MKVLYDHQAFQMQYFGGVSKCFCELIKHLPSYVDARISIVQSDNSHLWESGLVPQLQHVTMDHKQWNARYPGRLSDILYLAVNKFLPLPTADSMNRRATRQALHKQDFDVFHPTYFKPDFLKYVGKRPFVITVHDMMPELFPQYYGSNYSDLAWKRTLVKKADAIVAVSQNTKQDLIRILGVEEKKVHVIYHGGPENRDIEENTSSAVFSSPQIEGRYFLYVGQRIFYKNFDRLLQSFCLVKDTASLQDVRLVCTGNGFTYEELQLISRLGLSDRVIHYRPTDQQMQGLYRDALAFVYPSAYEGFGMPILEAYANGCPCVLNRASCFPEVASDAAYYFTFDDGVEALSSVLLQIADLPERERQAMIDRGYARLKHFSWRSSAEQLVKVYESVI